jgi:glycerate kinase
VRNKADVPPPPDAPVLCCPDKFRGSLTAREAAEALARGVERAGRPAACLPLADGGEGTLDVLCPDPADRRWSRVTGPLGELVDAEWGMREGTAVVEMARASGHALVRGANDPLRATTRGTGELIRAALDAGANRVIVGMGGSATTDGGLGALEALGFDLRGAEVEVACDVSTRFRDAPRVFGPQKGATTDDIAVLERRLDELVARYRRTLGIDVDGLPGGGAAGGLAGGLAAAGARLVPGAALVATVAGLDDALATASLAITGEGRFDPPSLEGKVVGHVIGAARATGTPVAVVAGDAAGEPPPDVPLATLVELAGSADDAMRDAARLVEQAAARLAERDGLFRSRRAPA